MPPITDPVEIRARLELDRHWAIYALGDLAPGLFEHAEWLAGAGNDPALVLLYRGFGTPVLFALGAAEVVAPLLEEMGEEPKLFLHIRPEILELLRPRYEVRDEAAMWRMILDPARFPATPIPVPSGAEGADVVRLGPDDLSALQSLYADGEPAGEEPGFFFPQMLEDGVYFGVREDAALVAAAGTHLVVPSVDIAAIGNIYTRRDRRSRSLATRVTGAVTEALLRQGLGTIALNVNQQNAAAIRVYERLGFTRYCAYREGWAVRKAAVPT